MASNVNITLASGQSVPLGERYVHFTTRLGRRVTSLGVLFNFGGAASGLHVQSVQDMIREAWFAEAIAEQPDVFILIGHMPVRRDKWPVVIDAIRTLHPTTPIIIFGGHTHIRDCEVYDAQAVGLESGRYMETVGWLAANSTSWPTPPEAYASNWSSPSTNLSFSRSYIDANRRNYAIHAGLAPQSFDTPQGKTISASMATIATAWNLSHVFGVAPHDYSLDNYEPTDDRSLLNLLTTKVMPTIVSRDVDLDSARTGVPNIVLANSGSQRFSIYSGNFTKNDQYIVSPFIDYFMYVRDVQWQYAAQLVGYLNEDYGAYFRRSLSPSFVSQQEKYQGPEYERGDIDQIYNAWRKEQSSAAQDDLASLDAHAAQLVLQNGASPGYVTKDHCPGPGDDTVHTPMPYVDQPDYVQSPPVGNTTGLQPEDKVDVIFVDFIESSILSILNDLQKDVVYTKGDVKPWGSGNLTTQQLYPLYAERFWSTP